MASEIQFKGLAAISYRMKLLRKLAESDDPITSTVARRLITDRQSCNIGLLYEFILLVFLPLIQIAMFIVLLVQAPPSMPVGMASFSSPSLLVNLAVMYFTGILSTLAWLAGLIIGVLPGLDLVGRDPEGDLLRKVTLTADEILRKLVKIQWVSFAMPEIVGGAITLLITILGSLTGHSISISMSGTPAFEGVLMGLFQYVHEFMSAILFGVAGIMIPMLLGRYWPTVAGFIGFQFVAQIVAMIPYIIFIMVWWTAMGSVFYVFLLIFVSIAIYILLIGATLKLTRQSIHKRIMPRA